MIKQQVFYIVFSIILLPTNFCCAFWLFREALNLTGMTFREFIERNNSQAFHISFGRHHMRRVQRLIAEFFNENSSDPQKSIRLTRTFGFCVLPGFAALNIAAYSAMNSNKLEYAAFGDSVLVVINIALVVVGQVYRKNNPLDEITAEKLRIKREKGKKGRRKDIVVYTLVGTLFFGILLFFMMAISGISR